MHSTKTTGLLTLLNALFTFAAREGARSHAKRGVWRTDHDRGSTGARRAEHDEWKEDLGVPLSKVCCVASVEFRLARVS
jgi:hypothetical protein